MKARMEKPTAMGRYPWYVLGILTLAQTCHGIDRAIIGLVLAPVGREFALTDGQLGILAGFAYGIFFALAALPFGMAVDRWNRRNLMAAALTLWSGATALCGLATGFWTLVIGRAAVGTAEAGGSPTGMSLLSDYFGEDRRATAIGIWYLSSGIGLAIAFVVGGAIVQNVGWRWAFVAAGVPGLLLAPILLLTVREPRRGALDAPAPAQRDDPAGLMQRIGLLAARPGLLYCIGAIVLIAAGIYGMSTWLTTFLIRVHDMPIARAGTLIAIAYGGLGSLGGFLAGWVIDAINRRRGGFDPARTALFGAFIPLLTAVTGIATMLVQDLQPMLVLMMACGFLSASYNGPIYAVIVTIAGPRLRGLAVSVVQLGANLIGVGAGTYLIGAVSDYVGGNEGVAWGIGTAMLFTFAGGLMLLMASRAIRRSPAPGA
ncbi:MFS transporter [Sphingobium cupriresistens]|uniref:MFS transporter n=2 Tax=Sphingobium TaxID=165695 RepID=A0A8G2DW59_9SPHN|nr:MFS transporter [Sphingobium cupriresistens]MBJ7378249.1 MFS transporter [Sphingobium sp.]RYM12025.1 MFS transporter [Sphingobium cupriresistens]